MLLLTILLLCLLLLLSWWIFDKDFFAPPTVVTLVLLFGTLCTFYNENKWQLEFSIKTVEVIIAGVSAFIIGGMLAVVLRGSTKHGELFPHNVSLTEPIEIEKVKTVILIAIQVFTVVSLFLQLRRITGGGSWAMIVRTFRRQTALVDPDQYTMRLTRWLRQLIDGSFAISLIYAYIIGNNIAIHKKNPWINWIPVALTPIIALMQGYRADLLRIWIAILVVSYTLRKRMSGWRNDRDTRQMMKRILLSVLAIGIVFAMLRGTVGKSSSWDPLYYVTFYAGSPVAALDLFIKNPIAASDIWGKETFYNLNQSLAVWFHTNDRYVFFKEFRRSPSGIYIGNVYTALRPPYYDFGFGGMIIYMVIMGIFFTLLYLRTRTRHGSNNIEFGLLIYSYIAYTFFFYFYNLYNTFIAFSFVKLILELIIIRWFLTKVHIKFGKIL